MSGNHLEPLLHDVRRRAVLAVLRSHPEWTFAELLEHVARGGTRAETLRELTVGELFAEPISDALELAGDGGPPIDRARLRAAKASVRERFDAYVRDVIAEAGGKVGAAYLRARVGGPRWKLQSSLNRLLVAGEIVRSGKTSSTRYESAPSPRTAKHGAA